MGIGERRNIGNSKSKWKNSKRRLPWRPPHHLLGSHHFGERKRKLGLNIRRVIPGKKPWISLLNGKQNGKKKRSENAAWASESKNLKSKRPQSICKEMVIISIIIAKLDRNFGRTRPICGSVRILCPKENHGISTGRELHKRRRKRKKLSRNSKKESSQTRVKINETNSEGILKRKGRRNFSTLFKRRPTSADLKRRRTMIS